MENLILLLGSLRVQHESFVFRQFNWHMCHTFFVFDIKAPIYSKKDSLLYTNPAIKKDFWKQNVTFSFNIFVCYIVATWAPCVDKKQVSMR